MQTKRGQKQNKTEGGGEDNTIREIACDKLVLQLRRRPRQPKGRGDYAVRINHNDTVPQNNGRA